MEKRKKYLILYFIIILVILALILFILPDEVFLKKYKDNVYIPASSSSEKKEYMEYEKQLENLRTGNYSIQYSILDSMGSKSYSYSCTGVKKGNTESGQCTGAEMFSYTESDKKDKFIIDSKYLNIEEVLDLLIDKEPKLTDYQGEREYFYNVLVENLDTDITVYTDYDDVTMVELNNAYMTYVFKFKRVA